MVLSLRCGNANRLHLELFTAYKHRMDDLLAEWHVLRRAAVKEKIAARAAKVGATS